MLFKKAKAKKADPKEPDADDRKRLPPSVFQRAMTAKRKPKGGK